MKIYLLMTLIGTLLTAIHFTSAPETEFEDASSINPAATRHLAQRVANGNTPFPARISCTF